MIPFNVIYATLKGLATEHQYQDYVKVVDADVELANVPPLFDVQFTN